MSELSSALHKMDKDATEKLIAWRDMVGALDPANPEELEILMGLYKLASSPPKKSGIQLGDHFGAWRVMETPALVKGVTHRQLILVNEKTGKTFVFNSAGMHSAS